LAESQTSQSGTKEDTPTAESTATIDTEGASPDQAHREDGPCAPSLDQPSEPPVSLDKDSTAKVESKDKEDKERTITKANATSLESASKSSPDAHVTATDGQASSTSDEVPISVNAKDSTAPATSGLSVNAVAFQPTTNAAAATPTESNDLPRTASSAPVSGLNSSAAIFQPSNPATTVSAPPTPTKDPSGSGMMRSTSGSYRATGSMINSTPSHSHGPQQPIPAPPHARTEAQNGGRNAPLPKSNGTLPQRERPRPLELERLQQEQGRQQQEQQQEKKQKEREKEKKSKGLWNALVSTVTNAMGGGPETEEEKEEGVPMEDVEEKRGPATHGKEASTAESVASTIVGPPGKFKDSAKVSRAQANTMVDESNTRTQAQGGRTREGPAVSDGAPNGDVIKPIDGGAPPRMAAVEVIQSIGYEGCDDFEV
jgi:hypothetical protein